MRQAHYLIVNAFGRSNRGDSVLLDQCIDQIRLTDPQARITGVVFEDIPSAESAHPGVAWTERVGNSRLFKGPLGRLESLFYLAVGYLSLKLRRPGLAGPLPADQRRTIEAYCEADAVVSAPGGYIHDTNFAYAIALFHIHLAEVVGAPSVLAPQSVGPLNSALGRRLARRVLSACEGACVRERYSEAFLLDLGVPARNVRLTGDSAFWDSDTVADAGEIDRALSALGLREGEPFLGCTIVDWTFPNLDNVEALRKAYFEGMARVLERVHAEHGLRTVVFNQVASDLDAARDVARMAGASVLVDAEDREPPLLRAMIARSRCFLGTRFHSCIFAMMAGRPVTAISYLPKTEFIMNELGLADDVIDIAAFDADRVYAKLDGQLGDVPAAERRVQNAVAHYQATQVQFFQVLREIVRT